MWNLFILLAVLVPCVMALAAEADPVTAAPATVSGDSRFKEAHDLDHPYLFHPEFKNKKAWKKRAKALREQVRVAEGLWPMPERTPLQPVIWGKIDRGAYTVEKVFFASMPGHYVSGNLYRPKGKKGKRPGVLFPHGHWENGRFYENDPNGVKHDLETGAESTPEGAHYPLQALPAMLARMGCVVFHYDMVGNADSQKIAHREGFTDAEAELRLQSFMGLQTWNSIRSLDFLVSLPDVDPKRIGVTGASGGGTQTFILCAVDDRPKVAFPAVMVSESMQGGCVCENASLLRIGTNNVEIAALFAPKPQGMTGANDWTQEIETRGLPELKTIYGLYGESDRVKAKHFSFPHNYNQVSREMMYGWMDQYLKLNQPEPVKEKPFSPIPPAELSVYDSAHPVPPDAADAPTLRRTMTAQSEASLEALHQHADEYRETVKTALRVMLHSNLPRKDEVRWEETARQKLADGLQLVEGNVRCVTEGHQVPFRLLQPRKWKGNLVLWMHPDGKSSLPTAGEPLPPALHLLLDQGVAVLAPDVFMTGELVTPDGNLPPALQPLTQEGEYAGFVYGYNRSLLAERVHDLLAVLTAAQRMKGVKEIRVVGWGKAGPWALLACAMAGDTIQRAALDLNQFDFDQVTSIQDEMMLPGALKYGGIYGFTPLLDARALLFNARQTGRYAWAEKLKKVSLRQEMLPESEVVEWLLKG